MKISLTHDQQKQHRREPSYKLFQKYLNKNMIKKVAMFCQPIKLNFSKINVIKKFTIFILSLICFTHFNDLNTIQFLFNYHIIPYAHFCDFVSFD